MKSIEFFNNYDFFQDTDDNETKNPQNLKKEEELVKKQSPLNIKILQSANNSKIKENIIFEAIHKEIKNENKDFISDLKNMLNIKSKRKTESKSKKSVGKRNFKKKNKKIVKNIYEDFSIDINSKILNIYKDDKSLPNSHLKEKPLPLIDSSIIQESEQKPFEIQQNINFSLEKNNTINKTLNNFNAKLSFNFNEEESESDFDMFEKKQVKEQRSLFTSQKSSKIFRNEQNGIKRKSTKELFNLNFSKKNIESNVNNLSQFNNDSNNYLFSQKHIESQNNSIHQSSQINLLSGIIENQFEPQPIFNSKKNLRLSQDDEGSLRQTLKDSFFDKKENESFISNDSLFKNTDDVQIQLSKNIQIMPNIKDISVDRNTLKIHNQRQISDKLFESEKHISFDDDSYKNLFQKKTENISNENNLIFSNFNPQNIDARRNIPVFFKKNQHSEESLNMSDQDEGFNKNHLHQLKLQDKKIEKLEEKILQEEKKNKDHQVEIQELKKKANNLENTLKQFQSKNIKLKLDNKQIEKKNHFIGKLKEILGSFRNGLKQSLKDQTATVNNSADVSFLELQNKAMIKRFFQHEKLLNIKQRTIYNQKNKLKNALRTNSDFEKQKLVYEESLNMIRLRNKKSELELLELNKKNKKLENIIEDLTHKISDLELRLIRTKKKFRSKIKNCENLNDPQNSFSTSSVSDLELNEVLPINQINNLKEKGLHYKKKYEKLSKHYQTLKQKFGEYQIKYSLLLDKLEKE